MEILVKIGTAIAFLVAYYMYQYGITPELTCILTGLTIFNGCLALITIGRLIHRG